MAGTWQDIFGTIQTFFRLGLSGPRLKASGSNLLIRNGGDTADSAVTASLVNISGDSFVLNSDAAASGADWKITFQRPTTGMTANYTLTLPVDDGTSNQYLKTDGSGVLSWATVSGGGSTSMDIAVTLDGAMGNSQKLIAAYKFATSATLPASLTGSSFVALVAATASTTVTLYKNGASIGTLVWAAAGTVPTVTFTTATTFAIGDYFQVIGPATADATLADIGLTFKASIP
jgi:hypothetical protein